MRSNPSLRRWQTTLALTPMLPSHTLEFVDGDGLIAVVDEAKYPLRPSGIDQFKTITGQTVTFPRDV